MITSQSMNEWSQFNTGLEFTCMASMQGAHLPYSSFYKRNLANRKAESTFLKIAGIETGSCWSSAFLAIWVLYYCSSTFPNDVGPIVAMMRSCNDAWLLWCLVAKIHCWREYVAMMLMYYGSSEDNDDDSADRWHSQSMILMRIRFLKQ